MESNNIPNQSANASGGTNEMPNMGGTGGTNAMPNMGGTGGTNAMPGMGGTGGTNAIPNMGGTGGTNELPSRGGTGGINELPYTGRTSAPSGTPYAVRSSGTTELPEQYRPLSPWAYFGLQLLFAIPVIGFIFLIVFSCKKSNINRRNFARSYWCALLIAVIVCTIVFIVAAILGYSFGDKLF